MFDSNHFISLSILGSLFPNDFAFLYASQAFPYFLMYEYTSAIKA